MRWASAVSDAPQLERALEEMAAVIHPAMEDRSIDLAILFASPQFTARADEIAPLLAERLPHRALLGCSAGGVIGGGREIEDRAAIALTVAHLPDVTLVPFVLEEDDLPDADASPSAWSTALGVATEPVPHFVLLADPFTFPADHLLAGLDYAFPRSTKVGGLASGAHQPGGNVLFAGSSPQRSGAVGVALAGDVWVDTVVAQGCRPVGAPMQITACQGNIVTQLDGKPALQVLQNLVESLPQRDLELVSQAVFLGVVMDELATEHHAGDFLIRNVLGADPQSGALAVGERLRRGQTVQFHVRDARTSAEDLNGLLGRFATTPASADLRGALLFSCLGRGMHLYGRPDHDTDLFRTHLGGLPLGGFFCNGEIGPVSGATHLHGFTSSFGLFRPARSA